MDYKCKKSRAFTLLEVLMVMLIMAAVFFPLLQMLSSGLIASNEVKGSNTAAIIAQEKLEQLKNTSFASIASASRANVAGYAGYQSVVTVATPSTNLKDIRITVFWNPGEGLETCITVETIVSNF